MAVYFDVDHMDFDGNVNATFRPNDLRWSYRMQGDGAIAYAVSLTDAQIARDEFAPVRTDWQLNLRVGDSGLDEDVWDSFPLTAGILAPINLISEEEQVNITGRDWLWYLEQPYPWDYTQSLATWLTGSLTSFQKTWLGPPKTQTDVVNDLLTSLTDPTYDPQAPLIVPNYIGAAWAESMDYSLEWGDSTTILDHLRAISQAFSPYGFDFWVDADKTMQCKGPRTLNPSSLTPAYTLTTANIIADVDWTNNGPLDSETVGMGSGSGIGRPWYSDFLQANVDQFRRWKKLYNISSPTVDLGADPNIVQTVTVGWQNKFPQKELRLTVVPEALDPSDETAGFFNILGEAIRVTYDFPPYHAVDANFYVTGQEYYGDDEGNFLCDFTLDQVYGTI